MTWSLLLFAGLTVLITVFVVGWIWAESKPRILTKRRSEDSTDYVPKEGLEEE